MISARYQSFARVVVKPIGLNRFELLLVGLMVCGLFYAID
jgi:hypothetical protein